MRSFHRELINANAISAMIRTEDDGSKSVTVEYEDANSRYYKGVMKVDLMTFIF